MQSLVRGWAARKRFLPQLRVHTFYSHVLPGAMKLGKAEAAHIRASSGSSKADGYGEMTSDSARMVLDALQLQAGDVLCDLGSGSGRFALQAAVAHPQAHCIGVELAPSRHAVACGAAARAALPNLALVHGDLIDATHCADATLIYVSPILFHADFLAQIGAMLDQLPKLRVIASLGRRFPPSALATFDERPQHMEVDVTWRDAPVPVCFYDKVVGADADAPPTAEAATAEAAAWAARVARAHAEQGETPTAQQLQLKRAIFALDFNRYGAVYDGPLLRARAPPTTRVVRS